MSQMSSPGERGRFSLDIEMGLMALLLAACAILYFHTTIRTVRWNDPAAYVYAGRQLAAVGAPVYVDENNASVGPYFTLHGFAVRREDIGPNFYLNHAIGLPLLLALGEELFGSQISPHIYVVPLLSLLGLVFVFALGRTLIGKWVGLLAAGLLALSLDYWTYGTETWSDVPAAVLVLGGVLFTVRALQRNSGLEGALAGFLLGYACLVRYFSALSLLPLAAYTVMVIRGKPWPWRAQVALAAALAAFAVAILAYNTVMFGAPLASGYDARYGWVPWPAFSWENFIGQSPVASGGYRPVLVALWRNAHVWLLVAVVGLFTIPRPAALLLGGNLLLTGVAYAAYLWPSLDARFVMLAVPMVFLAAAGGVTGLLSRVLSPDDWRFAPIIAGILLLWYGPQVGQTRAALLSRNSSAQHMLAVVQDVAEETEEDAVFLSHRFHDLLILYGQRSAFYYALLAPADPEAGIYRLDGYEERLVEVVNQLMALDKPVYVVRESEGLDLRQGPIDPFPILSARFTLTPRIADPPVYRVEPPGGPAVSQE